jgi:hypothetical protein
MYLMLSKREEMEKFGVWYILAKISLKNLRCDSQMAIRQI